MTSSRARFALALALSALCAVPAAARADDPATGAHALGTPRPTAAAATEHAHALHHDPAQFALDLSAMTVLPLVVGGNLGLEVPGHIVVRVGAGMVPSAYLDAINQIGTGWGAYDTQSARMFSSVLTDALWLEFGLGIRPAGTPGIELDVSYAMLWAHRGLDMTQLGMAGEAGMDMTIDAIHGEVAWQNEIIDHVYFRIALGWAHAFDHHVTFSGNHPDDATRAQLETAASALSATIGRYAFGPTLGSSLGVRF
jgi:hypothetical protein